MNHYATGQVNVSFPMDYLKEARKRGAKLYAVVTRALGTSTRVDEQVTMWGDLDDDSAALVSALITWLADRRPESLARIETAISDVRARNS